MATARKARTVYENFVSDYTPFEKQLEVHKSRKRYRYIHCGARAGKDRCSINEFIKKFVEMLGETEKENPERSKLIPRVHGWIIAPTIPLAAQSWRELKAFMPKDWVEHVDENEKCMYTADGGIIEVKSTSNPESLVAVGLDIVLWTEAAKSKPYDKALEAWNNIYMRLQSPGRGPKGKGGLVLVNSTPDVEGKWFQELYILALSDKKNWDVFHWRTSDNPYIRPEEEENARKMMTADQFEVQWNGNFPKGSGEIFANLAEICILDPEPPVSTKRYIAAWDPASPNGEDDSLFGIRDMDGKQVLVEKVKDKARRFWKHQHERIAELCKQYGNCPLIVLKTGLGEQSIEALMALGVNVIPVQETPALKVEMVMHFAFLCEKMAIRLINDPFQIDQLKIYGSKTLPSGAISYGAPRHKHDDSCSMLMALYKSFNEPTSTLPFIGTLLGVKRKG
jgi:predicted Fe-Mo cluster-binding NifX family protein